jgi:hypothetical protein
VKNWQKTVGIEKKLDIISRLEKVEQIIEISHYVTVAFNSVHTIYDNIDRIKKVLNYFCNIPTHAHTHYIHFKKHQNSH